MADENEELLQVDFTPPPRVRSRLAGVIESARRRFLLAPSPLGRQMERFCAHLEAAVFPAARAERPPDSELALWVTDHGRTVLIEDVREEGAMGPFDRLADFLDSAGIRSLSLDAELESNQVCDVLKTLWDVRHLLHEGRCGWWARRLGRRRLVDELTSPQGLHVACADVTLDLERGALVIRDSYCPLTFSLAVDVFKRRASRFRDHRAFFQAAPRFALAAAGLALVPAGIVMLVGHMPGLVLAVGLVMAVLVAAVTVVVFETIGAVEYDKEYQARQLLQRHRELESAHERIQADLGRARRVQQMLIPPQDWQPLEGSVRIAHAFVPEMAIGGDYYDIKRIGEDRLALLFADVSGHGMASAFITGIIKTTFELADRSMMQPCQFLGELNDILERITPMDSFAAIVVAVYDAPARRLTYTNAGHQPLPLLVRANGGGVEALEGAVGLVSGVTAECVYEQTDVELFPGDRFVLCTDGIIESVNAAGELFGLARLRAVLEASAGQPASELPAGILSAVSAHTGATPQMDDQTVLVMEVVG